ncbi:transient receptor potential cation channel subfamily A member 1 [Nematostella vectensis]|uniref:transient receptor potential cation channel subfamily A member 1 n=1 Tax=Nematostella vectensis TaxID=45351 RepID=UPI002076D5E9|nr:transient receptor potential cation channel subfamily A member 1 [Nematostella vectensis]
MGSRQMSTKKMQTSFRKKQPRLSDALMSVLGETCGEELERGESFFGRASMKKADEKVMADATENGIQSRSSFSRKLSTAMKLPKTRARPLNIALVQGLDISEIRRLVMTEDVNVSDEYGKTPLHCAAHAQNVEAVELLLERRANVNVLDDREETPLHAAVRTGKIAVINALLNHPKINVNLSGPDTRTTPLHLIAQLDHPTNLAICNSLLSNNADLLSRDSQNMLAISYSAKKGQHDMMNCFFKYAKEQDRPLPYLLYDVDSSSSSLLHLAVTSSNSQAVAVCLKHGADVHAQRSSDETTAVHIACSRGPYEVVKQILESVSYKFDYALTDHQGLTCLHRAAKFNHSRIVNLLLDQNVEVNPLDDTGKTPLMCAVFRGCEKAASVLIRRNASLRVRDNHDRNVAHLAVGCNATLQLILKHEKLDLSLVKEKDKSGSTPLHYAAKGGYPLDVELLLSRKRELASLTNANEDTPLHIAVCNGWLNIVQLLLEGSNVRMVNWLDKNERTPLHLAAKHGHVDIVDFLLHTGASIQRDRYGQTALHLAAWVGSLPIVDLLLSANFFCLNQKDEKQEMALHLAVQAGHADLVEHFLNLKDQDLTVNNIDKNILDMAIDHQHASVAMVMANSKRWREVFLPPCNGSPSQMELLVQKMPGVVEAFLDRCIRREGKKNSPDHKITYNLHYLQGMPNYEKCIPKNSLKPLYAMVKYKRLKCLQHPTSLALINVKWRRYGLMLVLINQLLSILYLCFVIGLVSMLTDNPCFTSVGEQMKQCRNTTRFKELRGDPSWPKLPTLKYFDTLKYLLVLLSIAKLLSQIVHMYTEGWRYLTKFSYLMELALCSSMIVFLLPDDCRGCYGAGAVAACLAWFSLMSRIASVSFLGIYLMMLAKIFVTVARVFVLLFMFLLCFAFSFYVMDFQQVLFYDIFHSLATTFVMLMGEVHYETIFLEKTTNAYIMYPLYMLFVICVPIIFLNLLIGLAVGDIASIQKIATLERYSAQVEQLHSIERIYPRFIVKRWQMRKYVEYPNRTNTLARRIVDVIAGTLTTAGFEEEQRENEVEKVIDEQEQRMKTMSVQLESQTRQLEFMKSHMERIEEKLTGSLPVRERGFTVLEQANLLQR